MSKQSSFLSSTAFSGLVVLLPLAILFLVGIEIYGLLEDTAAFARLDLPFPGFINALIYIAMVFAVLFGFCFTVGLLLMTGPGKRFANFVDKGIAEKIPLVGLVRNLTMKLAGKGEGDLTPVEVDIQGTGTSMLGFLMEVLDDGRQVVFIPSAPAVTLGTVYIVPAERVTLIDASLAVVATAVSQWGVGTNEAFRDTKPE